MRVTVGSRVVAALPLVPKNMECFGTLFQGTRYFPFRGAGRMYWHVFQRTHCGSYHRYGSFLLWQGQWRNGGGRS